MKQKVIELKPIKETVEDYDDIEAHIKALFKRMIYLPIMKELADNTDERLENAKPPNQVLLDAISKGRLTFNRGVFSGKFNATLSKELKSLGAKWDRRSGVFRINQTDLPREMRTAISSSEYRFTQKLSKIDKALSQILPEKIAGELKAGKMFDKALWKVESSFQQSVKGIAIAPKVTPQMRKQIADEWNNNLELYIVDFTTDEIKELRHYVQKSAYVGNRYGSLVKKIQDSFGVSSNKAKFLARQETSLLMTKYKQSRYKEAGIFEYTWHSVAGSPKHPVRKRHQKLADASKKGKIYRWDKPPVTSEDGEPERRNNPGEDFNCRCSARPVVRF